MSSTLIVVDLYPSLLQPEGDHGNAVALAYRARRLGGDARAVIVHPGDEMPEADVVMLGGSMDADAAACAETLRSSDVLSRAWDAGATVLGVGAGFCMLAHSFVDLEGEVCEGVGLLDVHMEPAPMASGPVVTKPNDSLRLPAASGYEHHAARAIRAAEVPAFVELEVGVGDHLVGAEGHASDGAVGERVLGTWVHGPLLPRNPAVADLLLRWSRPRIFAESTSAERVAALSESDEVAAAVRQQRITDARLSRSGRLSN